MSTQTVIAMLCYGVAAILALTSIAVPPARAVLLSLALAAIALGLAVQVS